MTRLRLTGRRSLPVLILYVPGRLADAELRWFGVAPPQRSRR